MAARARGLRALPFEETLVAAVHVWPHAHQVHAYARRARLSDQARAAAACVQSHAPVDIDGPAQVVLRAMNRAIEMQQVAALHAYDSPQG